LKTNPKEKVQKIPENFRKFKNLTGDLFYFFQCIPIYLKDVVLGAGSDDGAERCMKT
jgi:hypothetical protein